RQRAGPDPALPRPVPGHRRTAARPGRPRRRPDAAPSGGDRLDARRRLPAADAGHRHPPGRRGPTRGGGQPHQALVVRARRRAPPPGPRPARPRRRAGRAVVEGLAVRAVRADLRRDERDPAQHRRRAGAGAAAMRFALSPDQEAFRDAVADLLAKACPPAAVRAAWEAPPGQLDRSLWGDLAGMGVLSVLVPEADGGLGLDETYLVPVLEACGQAALPHPVVETAMVAAPLLGADIGIVTTDLGGPNLPCAVDADALLLRCGDRLVRADPAAVALEPVETVDRARRAARLAPGADLTDAEPVTDHP